jgi:hypothetical protein
MRAAIELISDPKRWTQHAVARDRFGFEVSPVDSYACKWCLIGAMRKCGATSEDWRRLMERLGVLYWNQLIYVNDGATSHEELMEKLRCAST